MRCPACEHDEDRVVDSRSTREGAAIRRRRECLQCQHRFTTYEYVERAPVLVVKKDGRRVAYDREKLLSGLMRACEKRPVSREQMDQVVARVEARVLGGDASAQRSSLRLQLTSTDAASLLDSFGYSPVIDAPVVTASARAKRRPGGLGPPHTPPEGEPCTFFARS